MTIGDDQGNEDPPLEMGTRINVVATMLVNAPAKSTFLSFDLKEPVTGFKGRRKNIWTREKQLTGTVTQNTHRHWNVRSHHLRGAVQ